VWRADPEVLAAQWQRATPFPHIVIDDAVAPPDLDGIMEILDDEPVEHYESDIFSFDATAPEPTTDALRGLRDQFALDLAGVMSRVGGTPVSRVDMRAYAYRPGHYLLPHTDHQDELGRVYAYAYYLPSPQPAVDGALELYRCRCEADELVDIASVTHIEPRANRLVVFEVGTRSLHQVREVLGGLRISLAGWFYP
jgi:Rps23 Pro-64 3,4-dihydroxylase Tpa1-like proline 4-hydroxylase